MGMAASQARFLGLTSRKTNIEFEGQQINQQRTTLSNQSANYYNNLLGMEVPTPPSVDSYTKTVYTFNDGALENTITSLIAQPNGDYTLSYLSAWNDDFAPIAAASSIITRNGGTYSVGSTELRALGTNDPALAGDTEKQAAKKKEEEYYKELLEDKYGADAKGWYVRYVNDTSTGKEVPYFYKASKVQDAGYSATGSSQTNIPCYTIGTDKKTEEVKGIENCKVEQDSTGRYIKIIINANTPEEVSYALTTTTATDQEAYEDAMNQYEYAKYQYDQSIEQINAKIEIVQSQDKNLELRLKQLDTEQKAIQTEMDSVSKVIEKNTESSFKTFG